MADKKKIERGYVPPEIPKKPIGRDKGNAGYVPPETPKKPPAKKQ